MKKYRVYIEACGGDTYYEGVHYGENEMQAKERAVRKCYRKKYAYFQPDSGLGADFGQPVAENGNTLDCRIHIQAIEE